MAAEDIGCSLAEAAESEGYLQYLAEAQQTPNSMHVVYINTSLLTKAQADHVVPTVTCTSSNVVQTVLQGFAQVGQHCLHLGNIAAGVGFRYENQGQFLAAAYDSHLSHARPGSLVRGSILFIVLGTNP